MLKCKVCVARYMQSQGYMKPETQMRRAGVVLGADGSQIEAALGYSHGGRQPIPLVWKTGRRGLCTSSAVGARQITEYTYCMQELSRC